MVDPSYPMMAAFYVFVLPLTFADHKYCEHIRPKFFVQNSLIMVLAGTQDSVCLARNQTKFGLFANKT